MSVTAEEVQRRIENARMAGDDEAVSIMEEHLQTLERRAVTASALPDEAPEGNGALVPPVDPKRQKFQDQYENDAALPKPSEIEERDFINSNFNSKAEGGGILGYDNLARDIVKDPDGTVRWGALSPEKLDEIEHRKKTRGQLVKAAVPALFSGLVRQGGQRVQAGDEAIDARRNTQAMIWEQLPSIEQDRVRSQLAKHAGVDPSEITDEAIQEMPARNFKKVLDENPANEPLLDNIEGDERSAARGESWRRGLNKLTGGWSPVSPALNPFGAEQATGNLTGKGKYEGLEEKYSREGMRAPLYPGASEHMQEWRKDARSGDGTFGDVYEYLIRPSFTSPEGGRPGARIKDLAEIIKDKAYTSELRESGQKPFFPKDKTWRNLFDKEMWNDPDTKLPWNDWDGFVITAIETTPQIVEGVIAARTGGKVGASQVAKSIAGAGRSLVELEKARVIGARIGGALFGGAAEGAMIYDEVASDVRETLNEVDIEKFREDDTFKRMVAAGLTEEEARQLLTNDAAMTAGKTGFVVAGIMMGSPMGAAFGEAGAGRLAGKSTAAKLITGALGEPLQEGTQEVAEGEISDTAIGEIDPDNPIFADKNRRLERFAGGAFIASPMSVGALGVLVEPEIPVGLEKEDVEAAKAAAIYFEATDARYKLELKISDPAHIATTNPIKRLAEFQELERLQKAEAEQILESEPTLRTYFQEHPSQTSKVEMKMLDALVMRANATLTDIAVARSRKQTAVEMVKEQETILAERAAIQKKVTDNLMKMDDIERQIGAIEAVQNNEPVSETDYAELLKEGYGRWANKNQDKFVLRPKGKRALNLLQQQKKHLLRTLAEGYSGVERRSVENQAKRDAVTTADESTRETMIYQDHLTGVQNRRAYDERGVEAPVVAAVDLDTLAWVNDNMGGHGTGDRMLMAVADALSKHKDVEVYRVGGDEFAVTGPNEKVIETALQAAAKELIANPIAVGEQQVGTQISWGKAATYEEADLKGTQAKADRRRRGVIASRKSKPATWAWRKQQNLFHRNTNRRRTGPGRKAPPVLITGEQVIFSKHRGDELDVPAKLAELINLNNIPEVTFYRGEGYIDSEWAMRQINSIKPHFPKGEGSLESVMSTLTIDSSLLYEEGAPELVMTKLKYTAENKKRGHKIRGTRVQEFNAILDIINTIAVKYRLYGDNGPPLLQQTPQFPSRWSDVRTDVARGDSVEILTPDNGAVMAVVTKVNTSRKKPRLEVSVGGRMYVFNPAKNHLITANVDRADLTWLTNEEYEYGEPVPQVVRDVQIGHIGRDGDYFADIAIDYLPSHGEMFPQKLDVYGDWWRNEYPEWDDKVVFIPKTRVATDAEMKIAEDLKRSLTENYGNLPPITLVGSVAELEKVNPDLVRQIRSMKGTSISAIRGFFDELKPENGVVILVQNLPGVAGTPRFDAAFAETLFHEMVGHYGIRGVFGDEQVMRDALIPIVKAFPTVARTIKGNTPRSAGITDEAYEQLIGEEMIAYITGEMMAGTITLTPPQRTVIQKFFDFIRDWMVRNGWMKHFPDDTKYGFWTDERVQSLVARAQDFTRTGKGWSFKYIDGRYVRLMRDANIFQLATIQAINDATKTLSKREQTELQKRYPEGQVVPKEVPLFPEVGSPNIFKTAVQQLAPGKLGLVSNKELELTNLSDKGEFNFFRDSTYDDIRELTGTLMTDPNTNSDWYKGVMPVALAEEMETLLNIVRAPEDYVRPDDRGKIFVEAENRLDEILSTKIDQKKTQLTKDHLLSYLASDAVVSITVTPSAGYPSISYSDAAGVILGPDYDVGAITPDEERMIQDEIAITRAKGYNLGFNEEQGRWLDRKEYADYEGSNPQGANFGGDYRVAFIRQKGGGIATGGSAHFGGSQTSGVLVHIRSDVAEVYPVEGQVFPIALREALAGKLLSLVELQTDWLQDLRKGFKSPADKSQSEARAAIALEGIRTANKVMGLSITDAYVGRMKEIFKPIANLPAGSLRPEFDEYITRAYGDGETLDTLSETQQQDAYKTFRNSKVGDVVRSLESVRTVMYDITNSSPEGIFGKVIGTLDARAFEQMDKYVVRRLAKELYTDLGAAVERIRRLEVSTTQVEFVADINEHALMVPLRSLNNTFRTGLDNAADLRMPAMHSALSDLFNTFFNGLGMEDSVGVVSGILGEALAINTATYSLPMTRMHDYVRAIYATPGSVNVNSYVQQWFEPARMLNAGIHPNKAVVTSMIANDGETITINVAGTEEGLQEFADNYSKLIDTWIDEHGKDMRESNREYHKFQTSKPAVGEDPFVPDLDWDGFRSYFDIEEHDLESPTNETREFNITTFEDFEAEEWNGAEQEVIAEHMNDVDWSGIDDDEGNPLIRDSDYYRELIEVDDDGDVDNSDAEEWLTDGRQDYENSLSEDDDIRQLISDRIREKWDDDSPMLFTGVLPSKWDSHGDVTEDVSFLLRQEGHEESVELIIDGDEVTTYYSHGSAFGKVVSDVAQWYHDANITPHPDSAFANPADKVSAPEEEAQAQLPLKLPEPNWDLIKSGLADSAVLTGTGKDKTLDMFNDYVTHYKKSGVMIDTPLFKDEYWRNISLKYLIADAVRRGLPGIIWNPGLATSARGGATFYGTATERLEWSLQTMDIRGETQEVWVISSIDMNKPMVVSKQHAVPVLGADVAGYINQQIAGKLDLEPPNKDGTPSTYKKTSADFLISRVGNTERRVIHYRANGALLGFEDTLEEANERIQRAVDESTTGDIEGFETVSTDAANKIGTVMKRGAVTSAAIGSKIRIIPGNKPSSYAHTFAVPTLAGARQSYEEISPRIWNKTLKKWGVQVSEIYIKATNLKHAEDYEGARVIKGNERAEMVRQRHGSLSVQEVTGENHGWAIVSENEGVIFNEIFQDQAYADDQLATYIKNTFGDENGGIKAFFIPINAEMREEFSGPVPPFHYDPRQDPALKSAAEKVGFTGETLMEKYRAWKEVFVANFHQGVFDRFYGIKRALKRADVDSGAASDGYVQTRMTTSLDSVMKAVLEYGHPVRKNGITEVEGEGLLDILQPVMNDIELWGMYMGGMRSKRLMLEGFSRLTTDRQADILAAAKLFEGKTLDDRILALAAYITGGPEKPEVDQSRRKFLTNAAKAAASAAVPGKAKKTIDDAMEIGMAEMALDVLKPPKRAEGESEEDFMGRSTAHIIKMTQEINREGSIFKQNPKGADETIPMWRNRLREIIKKNVRKVVASDKVFNEKDQAAKFDSKVAVARSSIELMLASGREHLFNPTEVKRMSELGDHYPSFARVAVKYAAFNKKVLDFAQESGIINAETRPLWENADYVPFYRVQDERMVGPFSGGHGIANQKSPIRRLKGGEQNLGDLINNIMTNLTKLVDSSMKNHAALQTIDALRGSGIVSKKPMTHSQELIPLQQIKKLLIDRGMNPNTIPQSALDGFQKMFAIQPPTGPGVISVLRDGKKEFYYTDDELLFRAMTAITKKAWGPWMNMFRAPKRLLTTLVTLDPGFMAANWIRDSVSAFVLGRDTFIPIAAGIKGFGQALVKDEAMRTMMSAGAAFENGYINQYDPKATHRMIKNAMKKKGFARTVLNSPFKLLEAWKALGSATENANRIAVYNAAIRAGKGKAQAAFEAKDLMDFSMGGDYPVVQFLIQTVPFLGARMQGLHRLGRGFVENPLAFSMKGALVGAAGLALWFAFKDDERYKELEEWDKDTYHHWWTGDQHYRLPKGFEVGAIFNTVPERIFEYMYSKENDAGKLLLNRFGFMLSQTFNANPIPQTFRPMVEWGFNYNFFTGRSITSPYEEDRMAPEEYRYTTSPTMVELARSMPGGLDTVDGKIRSPLHLENLYRGYTGTLGRYFLMAADELVRQQWDYPNPPSFRTGDYPVSGRFARGDEPRRTKYEEETYRLIRKVSEIQGSLRFLENTEQEQRFEDIQENWEPYIRVAKDLEDIRQDVSDINRSIMHEYLDEEKDPLDKRKAIDELQKDKNILFELGYQLRPGGSMNNDTPVTSDMIMNLIQNFGKDDSIAQRLEGVSPETFDLVKGINTLGVRELQNLAKVGEQ